MSVVRDVCLRCVGTVHAHGESLWGKLGHKLAVLSDETFAW
jgi:hypothetical protein